MLEHQFKDRDGREWSIVLHVYLIEEIQKRCGVDLFKLYQADAATLLGDIRTLVNVIYVAVEEQAKQIGLTDRDFGKAIAGDAIDGATNALMRGVADFYPSHQRTIMNAMVAKSQAVTNQLADRLRKAVDDIDPSAFFGGATS